jgi:hypothetical protein
VNRRVWTGVVAGVLAAALLLTVGIGAYRAGQDDDAVTRVVSDGDGEVVRVVRDHDWGPGPGFFLFPLLIILVIFLLARRSWGWGGGWRGPYSYGPPGRAYGPCGAGGPEESFEDWHRRQHEEREPSERSGPPGEPERTERTTPPPVDV